MTFLYENYIHYAIGILFFLIILYVLVEKKYFRWVYTYWFFKRSKLSKVSSVLYFLGFSFLVLSFLDLRRWEFPTQIKEKKGRTTFLLDMSSSMQTNDTYEYSRLERGIKYLRQILRELETQKISLSVFSDYTFNLVPFTDDYQIIDSKLAGLQKIVISNGGSNLYMALNNTIDSFKKKKYKGSIIVLTDGETFEQIKKVKIPDYINLGYIGLGTVKGGKIPIRDTEGNILFYKKYRGKEVISKIETKTITELKKKSQHFRYWIENVNLDNTKSIVKFLDESDYRIEANGKIKSTESLNIYLIVPGLILLIISWLMGLGKTFVTVCFSFLMTINIQANANMASSVSQKKEGIARYLDRYKLVNNYKLGNINIGEKLKLAELYFHDEEFNKAQIIYEDMINTNLKHLNNPIITINLGTIYFRLKKPEKAFIFYRISEAGIERYKNHGQSLKDIMRNNIIHFLRQSTGIKMSKGDSSQNVKTDKGFYNRFYQDDETFYSKVINSDREGQEMMLRHKIYDIGQYKRERKDW